MKTKMLGLPRLLIQKYCNSWKTCFSYLGSNVNCIPCCECERDSNTNPDHHSNLPWVTMTILLFLSCDDQKHRGAKSRPAMTSRHCDVVMLRRRPRQPGAPRGHTLLLLWQHPLPGYSQSLLRQNNLHSFSAALTGEQTECMCLSPPIQRHPGHMPQGRYASGGTSL